MLLYQNDAELLFPARVIPSLRELRGDEFRGLIDHLCGLSSSIDPEILGFSLLMIRLASCLTCTADSYRAMNGCTTCAMKTIRGYKGTDADIISQWRVACEDVRRWQETGAVPSNL